MYDSEIKYTESKTSDLIDACIIESSLYKVYDSYLLVNDKLSILFPTKAKQCAFSDEYLLVLMKNGEVYIYSNDQILSNDVVSLPIWKAGVFLETESSITRERGRKISLDVKNKRFAVCNDTGTVELFDFDDKGCSLSQDLHAKVRKPAAMILHGVYIYFLSSASGVLKVHYLEVPKTGPHTTNNVKQLSARLCAVVPAKCHLNDRIFVGPDLPGYIFLFSAETKTFYTINVQKAVIGYFFADSAIKTPASTAIQCFNKNSSQIILNSTQGISVVDQKVTVSQILTNKSTIKKLESLQFKEQGKRKDFFINNRSSTLSKVSTVERGILVSTVEKLHRKKLMFDIPSDEPVTNILNTGDNVYICTPKQTYVFSHNDKKPDLKLCFDVPVNSLGIHLTTKKYVLMLDSYSISESVNDDFDESHDLLPLDACKSDPGFINPTISETLESAYKSCNTYNNHEFVYSCSLYKANTQFEFKTLIKVGDICFQDQIFTVGCCVPGGHFYIFSPNGLCQRIVNLPVATGIARICATPDQKQYLVYQHKVQLVVTELTLMDTIPLPVQNMELTWSELSKRIQLLQIVSQRALLLYDQRGTIRCVDSSNYTPLNIIGLSKQKFRSFHEWTRSTGDKELTFLAVIGFCDDNPSLYVYSMRRDGTNLILNTLYFWMMGMRVNPRKKLFTAGNNGGIMFISSAKKNEYTCVAYFTVGKGLAETVYTLDHSFFNLRELLTTRDEWVVVSDTVIWILTILEITSDRKDIRVAPVKLKHPLDKTSKCFVYTNKNDILFVYNSQRKIHLVKYSSQHEPSFLSKDIGELNGLSKMKSDQGLCLYVGTDSGYKIVTFEADTPEKEMIEETGTNKNHFLL